VCATDLSSCAERVNTVTIYYIIKKRRVVERETAGARWWAVRFVTDREGRLEVGQPLKVCDTGAWAVRLR
jgi:hypothetical protein